MKSILNLFIAFRSVREKERARAREDSRARANELLLFVALSLSNKAAAINILRRVHFVALPRHCLFY